MCCSVRLVAIAINVYAITYMCGARDLLGCAATVITRNEMKKIYWLALVAIILLSSGGLIVPHANASIVRTSREGRTPSDHFPLTAHLRFK